MSGWIKAEEINKEELKKLIKKAIKSNKKESEFILILEERNRLGESPIEDSAVASIRLGKSDIIVLEKTEIYPIEIRKIAIVPKTIPVIIEYRKVSDNLKERHESLEYYIFTSDGWKKVTIYSY